MCDTTYTLCIRVLKNGNYIDDILVVPHGCPVKNGPVFFINGKNVGPGLQEDVDGLGVALGGR